MKKILITVAVFLCTNAASAHEFNWDNLMLSDAKLNPVYDYEVYVDAYMARYRNPVWQKYKNDEFELEAKREETIEIMKSRFEAFDLDKEFTINTTFKFGKYDFKQQSFPLEGISSNSYFYKSKNYRGYETVFPSTYSVYFINPEIIKDLSMERETAKTFMQSKKNSYGAIDRNLPSRIKFKIIQKRDEKEFDAEITEITIFDTKENSILSVFE